MALQIANPVVVAKVERLARKMGTTKTAAVESAVDKVLQEEKDSMSREEAWKKFDALLEEFDKLPRNENYVNPLEWDEIGLPI